MILWVVLSVLVLAISFVLAFKSMKDYQEIPSQVGDYGLFLIRNSTGLTEHFFNSIYHFLSNSSLNISFERLFKGNLSALVVFGPRQLLIKFKDILNLLELEDYTTVDPAQVSAWEAKIKDKSGKRKVFETTPQLQPTEQFWWQLVIWVTDPHANLFQAQIRAVVISESEQHRKNLTQKLQTLLSDDLTKIPKGFSNAQIIDFYKKRSFQRVVKNNSLTGQQILRLISL